MDVIDQRRLYAECTRRDLVTFTDRTLTTIAPSDTYQHNWHLNAIAYQLSRCVRGELTRLVITVPPRSLKSVYASVAFPAWLLGNDPSKRIVCVSYSNELAGKLAHDSRIVMSSQWYQQAFPRTRISRKNMELNFETTSGGYRLSTSVEGGLTGRGGDIIIIDDPIKADDANSKVLRDKVSYWFEHTALSRLNSPKDGVVILVMQRLAEEDLAGHVISKGGWFHLNLPAIAELDEQIQIGDKRFYFRKAGEALHPKRTSAQVYEDIKTSIGEFCFSAQYQQNPLSPVGNIIKWDWFEFYDHLPERGYGDLVVQSWDTAYKPGEHNDFSVCTTWLVKGNEYFLVHVLREHLNYPDLKRRVIDHGREYGASAIVIEDKGSGTSLIQDVRASVIDVPPPIAFLPEGDKVTRMATESIRIEARQVHLPRKAPWLGTFSAEILQFPYGSHDDQVDSVSQFLSWIQPRQSNRVTQTPLEL
jgi:predicted phage terminase large subunit-like protein